MSEKNSAKGANKHAEDSWSDETTDLVQVTARGGDANDIVPCFIVIAGNDVGQFHPLRKHDLLIGRGEETDILLRDTSVSRQHVHVHIGNDGTCSIRDLGSRNGTYVNGERVTQATLGAGDRVQLGNLTIMKLEYHGRDENDLRAQLFESGTRDALTGIYNRRYMDGQLDAEVQLAARHEEPLSLVVVDVDRFKMVNDSFGHLAGDAVLRHLARVMSERVRTTDILARYGGDELVLILRRTHRKGAVTLARAMASRLGETPPVFRNQTIPMTVSMGIATRTPQTPYASGEALFEAADKALLRAKQEGRNRIELDVELEEVKDAEE